MENYDGIIAAALIGIKNDEVASLPNDNEIDHTFSESFEKKMKRVIGSVNKKGKYISFTQRVMKRAAVIILCLGVVAFSSVMLNPEARADFKNAVYEIYENFVKFSFDTTHEKMQDFDDIYKVKASYIPKGFVLTEKSDEYGAVGYSYENKDSGESFDVYVSLNDGLSVLTDNEKSRYEKTEINGREAYVVYTKETDEKYGTVIITGAKITVTVYGHVPESELIKIAKGIEQ
ncbi:MAG: DUF4367 domain-containing protein [Acutalibacteraceae bacterium]